MLSASVFDVASFVHKVSVQSARTALKSAAALEFGLSRTPKRDCLEIVKH